MPNRSDRVELAQRLHDGLAQELVALGYSLDAIIGRSDIDSSLRSELREMRIKIIEINDSFRDEIYLLRRISFKELEIALKSLFQGLILELQLPEEPLDPDLEDGLARALLEIGRNSRRHSGCSRFKISFRMEINSLLIDASDDGTGKIEMKDRSFGLATITEGLARLGAKVQLQSGSDGNRYLIEVPLR